MDRIEVRRARLGDTLCAVALATILCATWAWRDWASLSALRLPDTDDMMRLQQIRDWVGGQGFADMSQHRLGAAPGLAMHWSRLPDLVPGALITTLTPCVGVHAAELVAVILWPTLLFAAALTLTARIARRLGGATIARTAAVVAAVAFPATTIFLPGRIDHHGFQIVLVLIVVRTLVADQALKPGLSAGLAAAASIVIGVETFPLIAAAGAAMALDGARGRPGADARLLGFGIALVVGLLAGSTLFQTLQWRYPACDGFTLVAWRAALLAAAAPLALALPLRGSPDPIRGSADPVRGSAEPVTRMVRSAVVIAIVGCGIVLVARPCLTPYGMVDPLLARLWLDHVGEAQPLFAAPLATAIGYAGVMVAGVAASGWRLYATRDGRWGALLLVQGAALVLTCLQVRGAYAGAILAAPGLAAVIAAARSRGSLWLAGAWIGSAGMLYPIAAQAVVPPPQRAGTGEQRQGSCTAPAALADIAALPPGRLLAPLDLGAYAVGATRMQVVGAPYHRNTAGNLAVYRAFLGSPAQAARIIAAWQIRYVAICPESFAEAPVASFAKDVRAGRLPRWLKPVATRNHAATVFAVEPGLFPEAPAR